jgi:hypothetical protein
MVAMDMAIVISVSLPLQHVVTSLVTKFSKLSPAGCVAHVYNPSYLGGGNMVVIQGQLRQKVSKAISKPSLSPQLHGKYR